MKSDLMDGASLKNISMVKPKELPSLHTSTSNGYNSRHAKNAQNNALIARSSSLVVGETPADNKPKLASSIVKPQTVAGSPNNNNALTSFIQEQSML